MTVKRNRDIPAEQPISEVDKAKALLAAEDARVADEVTAKINDLMAAAGCEFVIVPDRLMDGATIRYAVLVKRKTAT